MHPLHPLPAPMSTALMPHVHTLLGNSYCTNKMQRYITNLIVIYLCKSQSYTVHSISNVALQTPPMCRLNCSTRLRANFKSLRRTYFVFLSSWPRALTNEHVPASRCCYHCVVAFLRQFTHSKSGFSVCLRKKIVRGAARPGYASAGAFQGAVDLECI